MSERPKIRIKKKGDLPPTHVEPQEEVVVEEASVQEEVAEEPKQDEQRLQYDDFAKPIPWGRILGIISGIMLVAAAVYFLILPMFDGEETNETPVAQESGIKNDGTLIKDQLPTDAEKIEDILSRNMSLKSLLAETGVPTSDVRALESEGNKFSIRRLRAGDKITIAHKEGEPEEVLMIMIEPKVEPYHFYKVDASNLRIEKLEKQVEIRENYTAAIVEGTLGNTFIENNLNLKLISAIEEILAWSVDLFDVSDGDRFKVLYDEEFVNGKSNKIQKIKALYFEKDEKDFYAFHYQDKQEGYFSELGQGMKKSFLATPIKYGGVITSGYGLRVHPVTGHAKAHLGTDFAAPEGTPIQAVADGVITKAEFKSNNGNYVKMRHDKVYETQYLHMQDFAPGIRVGTRVKQGDIIGYVGTTGLSTGPHVCYRFWKNKKQEDPTRENAGTGGRIAAREIQDYYEFINPVKERIKEINYF